LIPAKFSCSCSPLTIPGIITVGPFIQVTAGIGYEVNAQGKFLARNNIGWSDMTAKIDMVNGDNSFIGEWTPTKPVLVVSLEFEGSASIGPFVAAGLKFGVDILNGKLTIAAGLEVKASLPVGITASIEAGTGMETAFKDCQGFNVTLKTMIEIYVLLEAGPARKQFNITPPFELPIVNQCIQHVLPHLARSFQLTIFQAFNSKDYEPTCSRHTPTSSGRVLSRPGQSTRYR
jgi:hypothetical protein